MGLKVYNTLSGKKEEFTPLDVNKIKMYVCGPTVYDDCHIGHARAYVGFDTIYRYLKYRYKNVLYVRNITDVDDKIIKKANDSGRKFEEVAKTFSDSFHSDMNGLGLCSPDIEPKASEHIKEMQEIVKGLIAKGVAYESSGDIYFSVEKFKNYGNLSKRDLEGMEAGARVEVSEIKKNPLDFALWKKAKPGEPSWKFENYGEGRPGWHIECSAMSSKYLGESFDIHGGGRDLIFPHHENEIAQSEAYSGRPFAKYWLHCGFLNINKEKMSKSLGNIISIKSLLAKFSPDAIKYFILSSHYRSPIDFSDDLLVESEKAVGRVYTLYRDVKELKPGKGTVTVDNEMVLKFEEAMDDDFNTAKIIGTLFDSVNKGFKLLNEIHSAKDESKSSKIREELSVLMTGLNFVSEKLGIFNLRTEPDSYFQELAGETGDESDKAKEIEALIVERKQARENKNWARADEIRKTLLEKYGAEIEDKKDGTRWKFVK
jgi:cysteinyl-tRNA synthetase